MEQNEVQVEGFVQTLCKLFPQPQASTSNQWRLQLSEYPGVFLYHQLRLWVVALSWAPRRISDRESRLPVGGRCRPDSDRKHAPSPKATRPSRPDTALTPAPWATSRLSLLRKPAFPRWPNLCQTVQILLDLKPFHFGVRRSVGELGKGFSGVPSPCPPVLTWCSEKRPT